MNADLNTNTLIKLSILAEKTGVSVHCIRTYVDQGLIQISDRTQGGLLLFNETTVKRLRFIKIAKDAGAKESKRKGQVLHFAYLNKRKGQVLHFAYLKIYFILN